MAPTGRPRSLTKYKRLAAVALPEELQIHANDANGKTRSRRAGLACRQRMRRRERRNLSKRYNKGLDFPLIDKEAIKDSIRQAIKADELFQSMVDEIYAEMGKPKPQLTSAGEAMGKQINAGVLVPPKRRKAVQNQALARLCRHRSLTYYQGRCEVSMTTSWVAHRYQTRPISRCWMTSRARSSRPSTACYIPTNAPPNCGFNSNGTQLRRAVRHDLH